MSARNKAIKGMEKSTSWTIKCRPECREKDHRTPDGYILKWTLGPQDATVYRETEAEVYHCDDRGGFHVTTTAAAFRYFRLLEWTYDKDGNWLCLKCSEGGK